MVTNGYVLFKGGGGVFDWLFGVQKRDRRCFLNELGTIGEFHIAVETSRVHTIATFVKVLEFWIKENGLVNALELREGGNIKDSIVVGVDFVDELVDFVEGISAVASNGGWREVFAIATSIDMCKENDVLFFGHEGSLGFIESN